MSRNDARESKFRMIGVLRAFVESKDAVDASAIARDLMKTIDATLLAEVDPIERYWKIPEWFELLIRFSSDRSRLLVS